MTADQGGGTLHIESSLIRPNQQAGRLSSEAITIRRYCLPSK